RAPTRYRRALGLWLRDLARDPTPSRVRRFGQAGVLAAELSVETRHLHAHFLHTPASVARYAAAMLGGSYSLSGHAKDVWTRPAWELREKLAGARFSVTCTAAGRAHLQGLAPGTRVELVYHGLDRTLFAPPPCFGSPRDGTDPADPVRLLSVGRFQPKKGFDVLLRALAAAPSHAVLTIVGYGPAEARLRALARALGVEARVRWAGQLAQPAVRALYRESDIFVLASRVTPDGDRDGLPNAVAEALSQGLPVVATTVGALPEVIEDGVNGRLVPPEDPPALAAALAGLVGNPETRRRLGTAGLRRLSDGWDLEEGVERLAALLGPALAEPAVLERATADR
ncbi:MAG TPA: glycosyltransferase family 4 protein, partial [Methylomirabilota bacterium]|nr:glycosyltransferase family 4 protein [Methylomirabilota bacterium]